MPPAPGAAELDQIRSPSPTRVIPPPPDVVPKRGAGEVVGGAGPQTIKQLFESKNGPRARGGDHMGGGGRGGLTSALVAVVVAAVVVVVVVVVVVPFGPDSVTVVVVTVDILVNGRGRNASLS